MKVFTLQWMQVVNPQTNRTHAQYTYFEFVVYRARCRIVLLHRCEQYIVSMCFVITNVTQTFLLELYWNMLQFSKLIISFNLMACMNALLEIKHINYKLYKKTWLSLCSHATSDGTMMDDERNYLIVLHKFVNLLFMDKRLFN